MHFTADFPVSSRSMLAIGTLPDYSKMTLSDVIKETVNRANQVKHLTELHDKTGWKANSEAADFTRPKFDTESRASFDEWQAFAYSLLIDGEYETALQKNEAVFPHVALGELLSFPKQVQQIENA